MTTIEMYTRSGCGYCSGAKQLLNNKALSFTEFNVYSNPEHLLEMRHRTSNKTYPQIFIDGKSIGGFDELLQLERQGLIANVSRPASKLDDSLNSQNDAINF